MGLLGAHVSIAGGLYKSIGRGDALECESIQIFAQSSRTWAINPLGESDVEMFKDALKNAETVKEVVAHNSYLLNLSTENTEMRKKSVNFFIQAMERCERLGIVGLITHPGSHLGAGIKIGVEKTAQSLKEVQKACKGFQTKLILENTAGQGGCVGCDFEDLAAILDSLDDPDSVYFCFDTQHAFAAGYDLRTKDGYDETMKKFDKLIGLKKIRAFHINDALKELGCHVDRHANIGKGHLGKEAFRPLLNDKRFKNIPMCLETDPGENDLKHKEDLKVLRQLLN